MKVLQGVGISMYRGVRSRLGETLFIYFINKNIG